MWLRPRPGSAPASSSQYLNTGNSDHGAYRPARQFAQRRMFDRNRSQDMSCRAIAIAIWPAAAAALRSVHLFATRLPAQRYSDAAARFHKSRERFPADRSAAAADPTGKRPHNRTVSRPSICRTYRRRMRTSIAPAPWQKSESKRFAHKQSMSSVLSPSSKTLLGDRTSTVKYRTSSQGNGSRPTIRTNP